MLNIVNPFLRDRDVILGYESPALWVSLVGATGVASVMLSRWGNNKPILSNPIDHAKWGVIGLALGYGIHYGRGEKFYSKDLSLAIVTERRMLTRAIHAREAARISAILS